MIAQLHGSIIERRDESVIVMADGTGIGFEVVVPLRSIAASGTEVRFFTSLQFLSLIHI